MHCYVAQGSKNQSREWIFRPFIQQAPKVLHLECKQFRIKIGGFMASDINNGGTAP